MAINKAEWQSMGDKVLSTGFSWDDYLGFEPVIDRAFESFHS